LLGGKGDDTMRGGEGVDALSVGGRQGADKVYGEGGWDYLDDASLRCTRRKGCVYDRNLLAGGDGNDWLIGHAKIYGGPGDDQLFGSHVYPGERAGPRIIDGGPGNDYIDSGQTEDTIYAQDGERDEIRCGGKTDTVYYDAGIDAVNLAACENRITQPPPDGQ
jgi:Ca2+-binding RTX toxin-like protein